MKSVRIYLRLKQNYHATAAWISGEQCTAEIYIDCRKAHKTWWYFWNLANMPEIIDEFPFLNQYFKLNFEHCWHANWEIAFVCKHTGWRGDSLYSSYLHTSYWSVFDNIITAFYFIDQTNSVIIFLPKTLICSMLFEFLK